MLFYIDWDVGGVVLFIIIVTDAESNMFQFVMEMH